MIHADSIKIDEDEGHIVLVIDSWTDDPDAEYQASSFTVDIHAIALAFYAEVQRELRPYALEAESARRAVAAGTPRHVYLGLPAAADEDTGYAPDDPKSPGFHERMVD